MAYLCINKLQNCFEMQKYIFFVIALCIIVLVVSCVTDGKKNDNITIQSKAAPKQPATSALAERLYSNFHSSPATQAQKDENALIEYAVEKNLDVQRTNSGLYYIIHREGNGPKYIHNQPVTAHYSGYFLDGKVFDASYNRGKPLSFNVGMMIPGWNEALKFMNAGTKAQLLIPSHLAYGPRGFRGFVEPNTPLVFDIETLPLGTR